MSRAIKMYEQPKHIKHFSKPKWCGIYIEYLAILSTHTNIYVFAWVCKYMHTKSVGGKSCEAQIMLLQ